MAVLVKAGTFTDADTTTQSITGVGFTPVVVMIFAAGISGYGAYAEGHILGIGLSLGSGGTQQRGFTSGSFWNNTAFFKPEAEAGLNSADAIAISKTAVFIRDLALSSLDSDGFTVAKGGTGNGIGSYSYLCIGGDVTAALKLVASPTTTGVQTVTGFGLTPSVVWCLSSEGGTSYAQSSVGWADASLRQGVSAIFQQGGWPTNGDCKSYQRTTKCAAVFSSTGTLRAEASLDAVRSDEIDLNWTTAPASSVNIVVLALSGIGAHAGAISQPTSNGTQATGSLDIAPGVVMLQSFGNAATTSIVDHLRHSIGVSDGGRQYAIWNGDEDNLSVYADRRTVRGSWDDALIVMATPTATNAGTSDATASLTSLDAAGFTLNWTDTDATVRQVLYLALEGFQPIRGSFVAGTTTRVTASKSAAFGLDGAENTHSESGVLKVFGKIHATEEIRSTNVAKGTGAVAGQQIVVGRNSSGSGAAGCLVLYNKSGTPYYLWVESGNLRIHTAAPTENNTTVSHTAGTVVGTQT